MSTLQELFPDIAKEWHPTKNGDLTPSNVSPYCNKKIWWICHKGHEYDMIVANRTMYKQKCPYCAGKRVCHDNNLQYMYPKIAKQWNTSRNDGMSPCTVLAHSNKFAWWICDRGHEWKTQINWRTKGGNGCPECSHQKINHETNVFARFPHLRDEWDWDKNKDFDPYKIGAFTGYKVWWICPLGHSYQMRVDHRSNGHGCHKCNGGSSRLQNLLYSELKYFYDDVLFRHKIDGMECDIFIPSKNIAIEVDGYEWHKNNCKNDDKKSKMLYDNGITLINVRENGLARVSDNTVYYEKYEDIFKISLRFFELLYNITNDGRLYSYGNQNEPINGFNFIKNMVGAHVPPKERSLSFVNPKLTKEWDYNKNGNLKPENVYANSHTKVGWICGYGHKWDALISNRNNHGYGCPICYDISRRKKT